MTSDRLFYIEERDGYSPAFGRLVSMMNYARHTTLQSAAGLSVADLDHLHDATSNSIGALLMHIAAVERIFQIYTIEDRNPDREDFTTWGAALQLGDAARTSIGGNPLEFYVNELDSVRVTTLAAFRSLGDDWLSIERPWGENGPSNHHFLWFHVFEDEVNHRGQIRWLANRLPGRN